MQETKPNGGAPGGTAQNYTVTVPNPAVHYNLADRLGSSDVVTSANGDGA